MSGGFGEIKEVLREIFAESPLGKKFENLDAADFDNESFDDGSKHYADDNGHEYRVGNELLPNNQYEIRGYEYETDGKGRIVKAEGTLRLKDREGRLQIKDDMSDIGKGDEQEGDDRGHLIGDQFDGSNGLENLIPQDSEINRGEYKQLESELAEAVKDDKRVYAQVEPIWEGELHRPYALVVTYSIDGKENVRIFSNSKEEAA